jgi:hypothetical protein
MIHVQLSGFGRVIESSLRSSRRLGVSESAGQQPRATPVALGRVGWIGGWSVTDLKHWEREENWDYICHACVEACVNSYGSEV